MYTPSVYTDDSMPDWVSQYRLKLTGVYTNDSMPDWVSLSLTKTYWCMHRWFNAWLSFSIP